MFRLCLASIVSVLVLLCSCSDKNNPSSFDENLLTSTLAEIEIGGIVARQEHFEQRQSGPNSFYSNKDTTPYTLSYSFNSALFDPSMSSLRDSNSTFLYTMTGYVDYIQVGMTLDPEGRFIRSLIINDRRGMEYYEAGCTIHKIETGKIPRVPGITHKYVFEVRGEALAAVLQHLEYTLLKEWHSYGVTWSQDEYTLLPGYKITPESYLRITLSR